MASHDAPPDYPERIKQLRSQLRLTQARLGELLGVSTGTVSRWESGQLTPASALWRRIEEAEEHGLYALARPDPALLHAREDTEAYAQAIPPMFPADEGVMAEVNKPKESERAPAPGNGDIDRLPALIERSRVEPGDHDERTSAVLGSAIDERPMELRG